MFKKFKKTFFVSILIIGSFFIFLQNAQAVENRGAFVITKFDVRIFPKKDATIEVREIVNVNFSQKRHGIYRKIPVRYTDKNGFRYDMKLSDFSVLDEKGSNVEFRQYNESSDVVLQIGDPNLEVIGDVKYVISYRVQRGIRFFDKHDEIYWNPIGVGWPTKIYKASSTVYFEDKVDSLEENSLCFTGNFGSTEKDCTIVASTDRAIEFRANRVLNDFEGLTVAVNLPKGLITEPTKVQYFLFFLNDNWAFLIPVLVFGIMFYLWYFRGKELELRRVNIVQYGPPDGLTPGEVGYLMKEKYSNSFVAADIVNLAVKGYLAISEIELKVPGVVLNITKNTMGKLKILTLIIFLTFIISSIVATSKDGTDIISSVIVFTFLGFFLLILFVSFRKGLKKSIKSKLVDYEIENLKDWTDTKNLTIHEKKLLIGLFDTNILGKIKLSDKKKFYSHVQIASAKIEKQIVKKEYFEKTKLNNKVLYVVVGILIGIGMFIIGSVTQRSDFFFSAVLTAVILIGFGIFMSKKTKKGAEAYWYAKGYKHYIDVAEKYRVEFNEKENIFEKTLPYAMVFGNVNKWAKAFEGIMEKEPSWYHSGTGIAGFEPTTFASNLNNGFVSATKMASVSPSSSSSGGSSGGGGGGGGGGSW